jgi:Icc-related predicted phosphoesterase
MKIVATSDLHGTLPEIPACDLLLIAGDVCPVWDHKIPFQQEWLDTVFRRWLERSLAKVIVGVWGNHDWIGERAPELVPDLPWCVLTDEMVTAMGLRIYGTPWQRRFMDWAFNLDVPELHAKHMAIPECDILVSHGPPYGYGDQVGIERTGSAALLNRIHQIKPKLTVFGHIHCDPGTWTRDGMILSNVTLMDDYYRPRYQPRVFEI